MRMMMQFTIPVEAGNDAVRMGSLGPTMQKILESMKPEAAYFGAFEGGMRGGFIVFDMKDTSQIPSIAEPFFMAFHAKVSFYPAMNAQDLANAGPALEAAAKAHA
jgi:hypothetical protein